VLQYWREFGHNYRGGLWLDASSSGRLVQQLGEAKSSGSGSELVGWLVVCSDAGEQWSSWLVGAMASFGRGCHIIVTTSSSTEAGVALSLGASISGVEVGPLSQPEAAGLVAACCGVEEGRSALCEVESKELERMSEWIDADSDSPPPNQAAAEWVGCWWLASRLGCLPVLLDCAVSRMRSDSISACQFAKLLQFRLPSPLPTPSDAEPFRLGFEMLTEKASEAAEQAFQECMLQQIRPPDSAYFMAALRVRAGRLDEALEWLRRAVDEFGFINHTYAAKLQVLHQWRDFQAVMGRMRAACARRELEVGLWWLHGCSRLLLLLHRV
jgi:hypothetical protein